MVHTHVQKTRVQRSVGSKDRVETSGRTDGQRDRRTHWETLPALPHGRYVTDSRQTLVRVLWWHELTVYNNRMSGGLTLGFAMYLVSLRGVAMPNDGLYFAVFFLSSFFFRSSFFPMPNLRGHWTDLNQTWTHIHLWLLFEKFGTNFPGHLRPTGWRQKRFFVINVKLWPNISRQWYMTSTIGKELVYLQGLPTCAPNLVNLWSRNCWEWLVSIWPPLTLNFRIGRLRQPYQVRLPEAALYFGM